MNLRTSTLQRLVLLAVVGLAVAYFAGLRPLARRVQEQDRPLRELNDRLDRTIVEAGLPAGTDFQVISEHLHALRASSTAFSAAEREARPRLEQPPEVRERLRVPFQLVEFLNESQRRVEELAALAQSRRVTLTPGLPRGFPRYQPELARPELLWVQLATVNRVVRTAINAGVREFNELSVDPLPLIDSLENGPPLPGTTGSSSSGTGAWTMLRVHLTVVGTVDSIGSLLLALALTPDELKEARLPEELGSRPALFLDHVLMRRNQVDAPEEVQLELVVSTVVPTEGI